MDVEDPPEPRPYTDKTLLAADAGYELYLSGVDGQAPHHGELRLAPADLRIANLIRESADGQWFGRLDVDGLPYDESVPAATPQEAADQAAVMYSVHTGAGYGPMPTAVFETTPQAAGDVLRQELGNLATLHRARLTDATAQLPLDQRAPFLELDEHLASLGLAVSGTHGSRRMGINLDQVFESAKACRSHIPDTHHRLLTYPLAHLIYDTRSSRMRLDATLTALSVEGIAQKAATAESPAPQMTQPAPEAKPAAQPAPTGAASVDTMAAAPTAAEPPAVEVPAVQAPREAPVQPEYPKETPAAAASETSATLGESADDAAGSTPPAEPPTNVPQPVAAAAVPEQTVDRPTFPTKGADAAAVVEQPDVAAATVVAPDTDLPLSVSPGGAADVQVADPDADLLTKFREVRAAVDAMVARGAGADLDANVREDLIKLQNLIGGPVDQAPRADAPMSQPDPVEPGAGETSPGDQQQAASAVNVALREADAHEASLRSLPEWQDMQTVRGSFRHFMTVLKDSTGEHFDRLMGDGRVAGFVRDLSIRVCDKIAKLAVAGAERLRRSSDGASLPSAEALLRLGDAGSAYGKRSGRSADTSPTSRSKFEVNVPDLKKMGDALARPMPGDRRASAAAARSRSTTAKRAKKPAPGNTGQAAHLRRGGPDQPQPKRPTR
ncbi:hypothetical protein NJL88_33720 [Streptomyces sp. DK15]|uniref:hypothetical protein n=1 Tax=Streptomyces sp. DK15 TaxID=2957499 RepID=UPI0029A469F4|nr:hypothetical protein [Streptomyces sp. DK15]MDX2394941.1 hypothetical protein [Streptomyces sp. DK15]